MHVLFWSFWVYKNTCFYDDEYDFDFFVKKVKKQGEDIRQ